MPCIDTGRVSLFFEDAGSDTPRCCCYTNSAAAAKAGAVKRVMPVRIDVTQEQSVLDALAEAKHNFGKLHIA
jgi:NAD(P)-dependent dehydrogenase (short-subunit alcohol dehydrogenase family)